MTITARVFGISALLLSFIANAETGSIEPGLWQVKSINPEMEKAMANLPPEMRKMMDRGVSVCMTKEQIQRGYAGQQNPGENCKVVDVKHSGKQTISKVHCGAPNEADIKSTMTHINKKKWTSVTEVRSPDGNTTMRGSGQWLKADCGSVKPIN